MGETGEKKMRKVRMRTSLQREGSAPPGIAPRTQTGAQGVLRHLFELVQGLRLRVIALGDLWVVAWARLNHRLRE